MGLDITAYERVKLVQACTLKELRELTERPDETRNDVTSLYYAHVDYIPRADGLVEGFYEHSGEQVVFRAGSYGGYNRWRANLAMLVGTTDQKVWDMKPAHGPFVELIAYSDCEGFLGPKTSAKLAADFTEWAARASSHNDFDAYFVETYANFRAAFELAARGGGVVKFH